MKQFYFCGLIGLTLLLAGCIQENSGEAPADCQNGLYCMFEDSNSCYQISNFEQLGKIEFKKIPAEILMQVVTDNNASTFSCKQYSNGNAVFTDYYTPHGLGNSSGEFTFTYSREFADQGKAKDNVKLICVLTGGNSYADIQMSLFCQPQEVLR